MKTLKQQITAIQIARAKVVDELFREQFCTNSESTVGEVNQSIKREKSLEFQKESLNDAGSTIAAVQFIGIEEIQNIHELIRCAKIVCGRLDSVENISAFADLINVLRKMGHGKVKAKIVSKVIECDIHQAMTHNYKIVG